MDLLTAAKLWMVIRPIRRWKERRKRGETVARDEVLEDFNSTEDEVSMDAVKGALKSKLVWLGLAQLTYSLFETWANGGLNVESVSTAISGALTIVFRAMTTNSLADKAQ